MAPSRFRSPFSFPQMPTFYFPVENLPVWWTLRVVPSSVGMRGYHSSVGFSKGCASVLRFLECYGSFFPDLEVVTLPLVDGEMLMDRLRGLERGGLPVWMGRGSGSSELYNSCLKEDATSLGSKTFLSELFCSSSAVESVPPPEVYLCHTATLRGHSSVLAPARASLLGVSVHHSSTSVQLGQSSALGRSVPLSIVEETAQ